MADIALLVVEEFERRKSFEKGRDGQEVTLESCFSVMARGVKDLDLMKEGNKQFEFVKRISEAKSDVGLAAINGFFSA